jgi:hypothetical protein
VGLHRVELYRESYGAYVTDLGEASSSKAAISIQSLARGALVRRGPVGHSVAGLQRVEAERRRLYGPGWEEAMVVSQLWFVKQGAWLIDLDYSTTKGLARHYLGPEPATGRHTLT